MNSASNSQNPRNIIGLIAGLALILTLMGGLLYQTQSSAGETVTVYKSPTCGCCNKWIDHLESNGFRVKAVERENMSPVKQAMGVPRHLQSCHTATVDGYIIEGHVPADLIQKLLRERPAARGLAVPGMPMGSPGMEGPRKDDYEVILFGANRENSTYATR